MESVQTSSSSSSSTKGQSESRQVKQQDHSLGLDDAVDCDDDDDDIDCFLRRDEMLAVVQDRSQQGEASGHRGVARDVAFFCTRI